MRRFVKFTTHDYMDEFPVVRMQTFSGTSEEDIKMNAIDWAHDMTLAYSGGTTDFVGILNAEEAREWMYQELAKLVNGNDSIASLSDGDVEWLSNVSELYIQCYVKG